MAGLPQGVTPLSPSQGLPPGVKPLAPSTLPPGVKPIPSSELPPGVTALGQTAPKPQATPTGLFSVNPGVNVVGDYLTRWTKFAGGGIRDAFRGVVDDLSKAFSLGIYDFDRGHHYAPNDPHLDGRAMDVDTINGEQVGNTLTPTIRSYIQKVLATPNTRVGVPSKIYQQLPAEWRSRAFVDAPAHIHTELAAVMPGQTVAPAGFKPDPAKGFVKDPQAAPIRPHGQALPPGVTALPSGVKPLASAMNPMDTGSGTPGPVGGTIAPMAHSF